jgi:hypothetical protein
MLILYWVTLLESKWRQLQQWKNVLDEIPNRQQIVSQLVVNYYIIMNFGEDITESNLFTVIQQLRLSVTK